MTIDREQIRTVTVSSHPASPAGVAGVIGPARIDPGEAAAAEKRIPASQADCPAREDAAIFVEPMPCLVASGVTIHRYGNFAAIACCDLEATVEYLSAALRKRHPVSEAPAV